MKTKGTMRNNKEIPGKVTLKSIKEVEDIIKGSVILPKANITSNKTGGLIWLKDELSRIEDNFDTRTELYKLLKSELTRLGHWKNKGRGNPRTGFRNSPVAVQTSQLRQALNGMNKNTQLDEL